MKIAQAKVDNSWFTQNQLTFVIMVDNNATQPIWLEKDRYVVMQDRQWWCSEDNTMVNIIYKEEE